ncbi:MAG: hypothetical protein R3A13_00220 [Bdellovibrionota bacterium]
MDYKEAYNGWASTFFFSFFDTIRLNPDVTRRAAGNALNYYIHSLQYVLFGRDYMDFGNERMFFFLATPEGFPNYIHWHILIQYPGIDSICNAKERAFFSKYKRESAQTAERMQSVMDQKVLRIGGRKLHTRKEHIANLTSYTGKNLWYDKTRNDFVVGPYWKNRIVQ